MLWIPCYIYFKYLINCKYTCYRLSPYKIRRDKLIAKKQVCMCVDPFPSTLILQLPCGLLGRCSTWVLPFWTNFLPPSSGMNIRLHSARSQKTTPLNFNVHYTVVYLFIRLCRLALHNVILDIPKMDRYSCENVWCSKF